MSTDSNSTPTSTFASSWSSMYHDRRQGIIFFWYEPFELVLTSELPVDSYCGDEAGISHPEGDTENTACNHQASPGDDAIQIGSESLALTSGSEVCDRGSLDLLAILASSQEVCESLNVHVEPLAEGVQDIGKVEGVIHREAYNSSSSPELGCSVPRKRSKMDIQVTFAAPSLGIMGADSPPQERCASQLSSDKVDSFEDVVSEYDLALSCGHGAKDAVRTISDGLDQPSHLDEPARQHMSSPLRLQHEPNPGMNLNEEPPAGIPHRIWVKYGMDYFLSSLLGCRPSHVLSSADRRPLTFWIADMDRHALVRDYIERHGGRLVPFRFAEFIVFDRRKLPSESWSPYYDMREDQEAVLLNWIVQSVNEGRILPIVPYLVRYRHCDYRNHRRDTRGPSSSLYHHHPRSQFRTPALYPERRGIPPDGHRARGSFHSLEMDSPYTAPRHRWSSGANGCKDSLRSGRSNNPRQDLRFETSTSVGTANPVPNSRAGSQSRGGSTRLDMEVDQVDPAERLDTIPFRDPSLDKRQHEVSPMEGFSDRAACAGREADQEIKGGNSDVKTLGVENLNVEKRPAMSRSESSMFIKSSRRSASRVAVKCPTAASETQASPIHSTI
ncbi:hypothetical protein BD324DRAFT_647423 [Kockovaella imperatae]|uniref:BRCT domain-containing protein n=1 Tax=Kockovaella imperatae TaxID=4999 RepID=A0A1Y1UTH3_9TREE|nr:hypothetical protein BD324DRAFT_647423 [Kockovaella imperatae]ORX40495.1 hypothetical protein BD324DRAFT_647423 [Kockovaella imperatae]